jgi:hypothetical protein
MQSVLSQASSSDVKAVPFPHLIIEGALDPNYYRKLMGEFPSIDTVNRKNRKLLNNDATFLGTVDVLAAQEFSDEWKQFFRYHASVEFLEETLALIGKSVIAIHPNLAPLLASPRQSKVGIES